MVEEELASLPVDIDLNFHVRLNRGVWTSYSAIRDKGTALG